MAEAFFPFDGFTVTNKALTSNVATLTTSTAHSFVTGDGIVVAGVDSTFNGFYTVASTPTSTTLTYALTAANVGSTGATGTVNFAYTEAQFLAWAKRLVPSGVLRGEDNDLETYADATGMNVKVKTGKAYVDGNYYANDAVKTLTIAAAHATNPRIDYVVVRADRTTNTVAAAVVTGTPAGSPSAPALTQTSATWEIPLATVSVPANDTGIDANQVTDARLFTGVWEEEIVTFSAADVQAVITGKGRLYMEYGGVVTFVRASLNTAPTGSSFLVDVNKNGTTIFTTQGNRPTIAAAGFTSGKVTNSDVKTFVTGDYLTVDVDAIGSTVPGADLVVTVGLRRTSYT